MKVNRSRQREAILEIIKSTAKHLTAKEVFQDVRKTIPKISLGTVYRNINLLKELGEIREIVYGNKESRLDGMTEEHHHFHCYSCGDLFNIYASISKEIEETINKEQGLIVTDHKIEFYGYCNQCQRRAKRFEIEEPCFLKPIILYEGYPDVIKAKTLNHSTGGLSIKYRGNSLPKSIRFKVSVESLDIHDRDAEIAWSTSKRDVCEAGLSWAQ